MLHCHCTPIEKVAHNLYRTYVWPVAFTAWWQALETLHQQHTCIADFAASRWRQLKTFDKVFFIFFRISESRAARFGFAYATALGRSIHFWLVEWKHRFTAWFSFLSFSKLFVIQFVKQFYYCTSSRAQTFTCALCAAQQFWWRQNLVATSMKLQQKKR